MENKVKYLLLAGAAVALSGCGGSGTSITTAPTYDQLVTRADTAAAGIVDLDTGVVTGASTAVPTAGTADYAGYVKGDLGGGTLIGELSLTADFATNEITGSAYNFQHSDRGAYTGTLYMDDSPGRVPGTIVDPDPADPNNVIEATGTLSGDLTNGGLTNPTSIFLDGNFVGGDAVTDPSAIAGVATGTVGGEDFGSTTGGFIATQ